MKRIFFLVLAAFLFSGILSCSKKSGGGSSPTAKTETVSFKITLNPVPGSNQGAFNGACDGLLANGNYAVWKVNGVTRSNEAAIAFTQTDFQNGVLTLEATTDVTTATLDVGGATVPTLPFTVTVVPTINGVVTDSTVLPVTSTMQRDWTF